MQGFLWQWLIHTWAVTAEAAPWLLAGFLAAGLIHAWVPVGRVAAHLGGSNLSSVLKAAIVGVPLPLCSCSVIPVASSIRRSGASRGATAGFLISTPETGVDSISITYALLGPVMAILRPLAALVSAVAAGLLINRLAPEESGSGPSTCNSSFGNPDDFSSPGDCSCDPGAPLIDFKSSAGIWSRLATAVRYGFSEMFADLAVWLIIGFVLAGLISAVVPEGFLEQYVGAGWLAMLLVLGLALPLYVCDTSSTPVAAALIAKGLSPGTALVFLLVGPATNVATMVVVARELGRRSLFIYLLSIVIVAVVLGVLIDLALVMPALQVVQVGADFEQTHSAWGTASGAAFIVLLLNGLRLRYLPRQL